MSKTKKQMKSTKQSPFQDYWVRNNYLLLALGLLTLVLGFIIMAQGSWENPVSLSVSPIVLLLAYLIIIPLAILYRKKKNNKGEEADGSSQS